MRQPAAVVCFVMLAILGVAATREVPTIPAQSPPGTIAFADVTSAAGIAFTHHNGASGKKYLPETMGSGCAFLDFDGDGWQDLLFVQSMDWPTSKKGKHVLALYRNNRNGTFSDVTAASGLAVELYGLGVAAADYDNDGDTDIYITALGPNRLFRNAGNGRFEDVTKAAGVGDPGFSASAMWFDYDGDNRLDLLVANYVEWTIEKDRFCALDGKSKSYCTPEAYPGQSPTLYRNKGDGTFENATKKAGIADTANKMLGLALLDFDADGRLDVFGANDTAPNRLYRNNGNGTFTDVAVTAGVAFSESGVARAGMGVDTGDFDGSGREGVVIGNFTNEMMALYANEGNGLFVDEAARGTIGRSSMLRLTFAALFADFDLDGALDIAAGNGHVADDIAKVQPTNSHAQVPLLFRNLGGRKFEDVTSRAGAAFTTRVVARGMATGDYDGDGDLDLVITANNGPARLLRNEGAPPQRVRITLSGRTSNRDAIGARVRVVRDNGPTSWRRVKTGSSYLSQSEMPVTVGLGSSSKIASVEIVWPTGKTERVTGVAPGTAVTIVEGAGVAKTTPLTR